MINFCCSEPGCVVLVPSAGLCPQHEVATLADKLGCIGENCGRCRRKIRKGELVLRKSELRVNKRTKQSRFVWFHAGCDPVVRSTKARQAGPDMFSESGISPR